MSLNSNDLIKINPFQVDDIIVLNSPKYNGLAKVLYIDYVHVKVRWIIGGFDEFITSKVDVLHMNWFHSKPMMNTRLLRLICS